MNWQHLKAFLWLRWRLWINQWRRAGSLIVLLMMVVASVALATAIPLFIGALVGGIYLIPKLEPVHLMYVWDGAVVGFTFFWMIGLATELQRTEPLSLSKFLHLPVSVNGAFVINYVSSLLRLSLIVFVPIMLGFSLALVYSKGSLLMLTLPSLAAFLLMVTALTYQFQGWLASMISNPRRRRTVQMAVVMAIVLLSQLPNVLNFATGFWGANRQAEQNRKYQRDLEELRSQRLPPDEYDRREQEITKQHELAKTNTTRESLQYVEHIAGLANLVVPLGWLPLGVMAGAQGNALPAILGCLGMTLIGSASLWRAYRTTVGLYQGEFTGRKARPAPAVASTDHARKPGVMLLERRIPGFSESVSVIALGGFRSLVRAPESRMLMLSLLVMSAIFGGMLLQAPRNIPELARPLVATGAMVFVLFCMLQLMSNQFGFDRDGFRVFVLCAAPRRDILLGKNLAFAPMTVCLGAILLIVSQVICPMRVDHFLAMLPQFVSMYLLFCILTNVISIYAPLYIAAGSLKPAHPKLGTILVQLGMFMFLFPLTQAPTLLPLGIEALFAYQGSIARAPICLLLSLVECAAVVFIYRASLNWQGGLLQAREQKILESVTNRA